jgi:hypothetical protein
MNSSEFFNSDEVFDECQDFEDRDFEIKNPTREDLNEIERIETAALLADWQEPECTDPPADDEDVEGEDFEDEED